MTRRRVFFTHLMKTGGTSVVESLEHGIEPARTFPLPGSLDARVDAKISAEVLLGTPPEVLAAIDCFSVHLPPWVGRAVAPDALQVVVVREPVARTVSHLRHLARSENRKQGLAGLYDDELWRARLADYQTQILAASQAEYVRFRHEVETLRDNMSEDERAAFAEEIRRAVAAGHHYFPSSAIELPRAVTSDDVDAAIAVLDGMDVVGTTDDVGAFVAAVARRCRRDLPAPRLTNEADSSDGVDPALLERIRSDVEADTVVYEHARRLAARLRP